MPSLCDVVSISSKLYVYRLFSVDHTEFIDKSLQGKAQSSLNSSSVPSSSLCPPNQILLPSWFLPLNVMSLFHFLCILLYSGRKLHQILKKRWSLTQLDIGPMPWECRISEVTFWTVPYIPANGTDLKHRAVSMAKVSFSKWTTIEGYWEWWSRIVWYASAMSLVASWEPGGSWWISKETTEKVLQVVGKESESTDG